MATDDKIIMMDGIFGTIEIKYRPKIKIVDVSNYGADLAKIVSLQAVLKANSCDPDGNAPACYVATKSILPKEDEQQNADFKIIPGYSAEGATRLEALQNLYKQLAEYQANLELSALNLNSNIL